ncbi:MAG: hypothetical protein DIZ77_07155 [endosymbiont of Seepiophila jonesi]|uniref:Uncharacterized protein n=1 Tax=endosymbiont of Lamellibrachia luymesi TaxID=2200907 RepID=A0A370DY47_9GAMM|nr:MAG: hypothetical protein DIZ79_06635 [endosymbiont of Lamellibrachia luymesi]RDH92935.1 MAG: hypothetical protein DIZ77_07155 [endosymbiont of Seepiophila jonesi]
MQQDPDASIVNNCFAVVFTPSRRRNRFPENCVDVVASAEEAMNRADAAGNTYAAQVVGPSRSSEGVRLYYLDQWLDRR